MQETFHTVGSQDYKVDHEAKKVFKKQYLPTHIPPAERDMFPEGFRWLDTNGDYAQFTARYSAPVNAEPVVMEAVEKPEPPAPEVEPVEPPEYDVTLTGGADIPDYSGKKLRR
jgi:hypothetical protein